MKKATTPTAHLSRRELAELQALSVTFSMALHYETTPENWPSLHMRSAFWERDDVPAVIRGDGPERPDPRVLLYERSADVERYEREHAEWKEKRAAWMEKRITWLRRAARRERG